MLGSKLIDLPSYIKIFCHLNWQLKSFPRKYSLDFRGRGVSSAAHNYSSTIDAWLLQAISVRHLIHRERGAPSHQQIRDSQRNEAKAEAAGRR